MKNNQWYIIFGEDWGRHSSTGQFIAIEIAKTRNILWVNSLGIRVPGLNITDIKRIITKLYQFANDVFFRKQTTAGIKTAIHVITPIAIPLLKYKFVRRINSYIVAAFIKAKMQQFGITQPVVITAGLMGVDVIDKLEASARVYYCADKYSEFPGQDKELVIRLESELLNKVDIVLATSMALYSDLKKQHKNVNYVPHGVDYELFSNAITESDKNISDELSKYNHPIIGFIGLIGPHLNYEIIKTISYEMRDASIIMIGPVEDGAEPPLGKNIYYLGKKEREQLPYYIREFDVCITPYISSDRIRYANPTKVREYLAAGCPTICTPQDEVNATSDEVVFAENGQAFVNSIKQISISNINRQKISESVSNQTWHTQAERIIRIIESAA